jgi:hypothetical protein
MTGSSGGLVLEGMIAARAAIVERPAIDALALVA